MKKIWKNLIILPLFIITALCFVACGTERMISIELAFDSDAIEYQGSKGYILPYSDNPYEINVKITPSSFSADVLSWSSDATDVIVVNSGKVSTIGKGTARITAKYKNSEGETISDSIKVTVTKEDLPDFPKAQETKIYSGVDIKDSFRVTKEDDNIYKYNYYYLDNGAKIVEEVKNAGDYRITYVHKDTGEKIAEMGVTIKPYKISIKASSGSSIYGDELQKGFLIDKNPTDEQFEVGQDILDGIGSDKGKSIGKYVLVTDAKRSSNVGHYYVNVKSKLSEANKKNYIVESIPNLYTITEKQIVLAIQEQLDLKYGELPISNYFKLYDYSKYIENGSSVDGLASLSNNIVDYSSNVADLAYVYLQGDGEAKINVWGFYNIGEYVLTYKNVSSSKNIKIEKVVDGKLKIQKRQVEIRAGQNSKIYGDLDDYSKLKYSNDGGIKNELEIEPFLSVDYKSVVGDIDLGGEGNSKAPVGDKYTYYIDNTKNPNYFFVLANSDNSEKFIVKPCPIVIEFEEKEEMYHNPKNRTHIVGYYNKEDFDYILALKSFMINGVEKVINGDITCGDSNFDTTGIFVLPTGETLVLGLKWQDEKTKKSDKHFSTYKILLSSYELSSGENNFIVEVKQSLLHLNKTLVKVSPKLESPELYTKVYDADPDKYFGMKEFFVSCNFSTDINNINDIFIEGTKILSLTNDQGQFVILDEEGGYRLSNTFLDVGRYKIFLDTNLNKNFKNGMEYYDFVLDDSQEYVFTITQYKILIEPEIAQFKIYGSKDPTLKFNVSATTPRLEKEMDKSFTGNLIRKAGEDKGLYPIMDSSVSLGDNYDVQLAEGEYLFEIRARKILIEPISYDVQYGESNIVLDDFHEINYGSEVPFDENILKKPTGMFEGEFALVDNNSNTAVKVNGQYLANNTDESYKIVQGTFMCRDTNYQIVISNVSTFKVRKRSVIINMEWQNKRKSDVIAVDIPSLDPLLYTVSNLLDNAQCTVTNVKLKPNLEENPDYYYVDGLSNLKILITEKVFQNFDDGEKDVDTTSCYDIKIGQNILYYIERQVLNFNIQSVTEDGQITSVRDVEFSNEEVNIFTLVCTTPNYVIDYASSKYKIVYMDSNNMPTAPFNVGSYSVLLSLESTDSLLVLKSTINSQEKIELTKMDELQGGYIGNLTHTGLLNIRKTNIRINDKTKLEFDIKEGFLPYGSTLKQLPDIKTFYNNENVFLDVKNNPISLRRFENEEKSGIFVNYKYKSSLQDIKLLNASTKPYMINVMIQAGSGSDGINPNYNPLNLTVPLFIGQRIVNITGNATITINTDEDGNLIYNGVSKYCTANVPMDITSDIGTSIIYQYSRINTLYNDSSVGKVSLHQGSLDGTAEDIAITELKNKSFDFIERDVPTGAIIAQKGTIKYFMEYSNENIPRNAGIYVCIIRVAAPSNNNYIFKKDKDSEPVSNLYYYYFFEIEKSKEIQILDETWKKQFYYGTVFNIEDESLKDTLPFVFDLNIADFREKVQFKVDNIETWKECRYMLPIKEGGYSIILFIEDKNYHFSEARSFQVISCNARIELPANRRFTYIGVDEPVTSFLKDIKAVKQDKDGNDIERINYNSLDTNFVLHYYSQNNLDKELTAPPYDVGQYRLRVEYGSKTSSHYGEGFFDYTIAKRNYDGEIYAQNKTIEYNPTFDAQSLYRQIREMVYVDTDAYSLKITFKNNNTDVEIREDNGEEWLKIINEFDTSKQLKFDIDFFADEIANTQLTANLIISKMDISTMFEYAYTNNIFDYSGKPYYNELLFRKIALDPSMQGMREVTVDKIFKYFITTTDKTVLVQDNLGEQVFTLKYEYRFNDELKEPIIPNLEAQILPDSIPYIVKYQLVSIGANYTFVSSSTLQEILPAKEYYIKKLLTLNVKFDSIISRSYSEKEYDLHDFLFISNYSGIKDNVYKSIIVNPTTVSYSESDGVKFVAKISKDGQIINKLLDAGVYDITLSFLRPNKVKDYDLSNFFSNVVVNGNPNAYSVTDFKDADIGDGCSHFMYNVNLKTQFTITKLQNELADLNKAVEYMNIQGKKEVVNIGGRSILYIDPNSTFTLPEDSPYVITFYKSDGINITEMGHTFEELEPLYMENGSEYDGYIEYTMKIVHKSGNYMDVDFVLRKYRPKTTDNPPPAPVE